MAITAYYSQPYKNAQQTRLQGRFSSSFSMSQMAILIPMEQDLAIPNGHRKPEHQAFQQAMIIGAIVE